MNAYLCAGALHQCLKRLSMRPHPVLMQSLLFPKLIPPRLRGHWKKRRSDGGKSNAKKRRGRRRKLVGQSVLRIYMIAKKAIDDRGSGLVHAPRVDISPETQSRIIPVTLDVGRVHRQLVTHVLRRIGYLTTTPPNARGTGTGADGREGMSATDALIKHLSSCPTP
jgi:hypothetical protein